MFPVIWYYLNFVILEHCPLKNAILKYSFKVVNFISEPEISYRSHIYSVLFHFLCIILNLQKIALYYLFKIHINLRFKFYSNIHLNLIYLGVPVDVHLD